jgi:hypothetical protein
LPKRTSSSKDQNGSKTGRLTDFVEDGITANNHSEKDSGNDGANGADGGDNPLVALQRFDFAFSSKSQQKKREAITTIRQLDRLGARLRQHGGKLRLSRGPGGCCALGTKSKNDFVHTTSTVIFDTKEI